MSTHRKVQLILVGQGLLLGAFAVASLVTVLAADGPPASVLGVSMNIWHSVLLLATALLGALAAPWQQASRAWVGLQAAAFTILFVIGSAESAGPRGDTWLALDPVSNFLHLALAVIAIATGMRIAGPWLAGNRDLGMRAGESLGR
ncbi:MAG: DUF4383 domain-containing protein [Pseudonocardiaceae bacterium]|nr:DUF4383 domain-containing protein [Pseudonocardiaceae bacterium]